ncbi:MAG: hypothetical protein KGI79_02820 [Patescibacteria group bacterium]|nr:hypothetical protein [Patescibacteria group bacterium]MDE2116783.1 hypothetical protein [Patescibacteria group bacterium]
MSLNGYQKTIVGVFILTLAAWIVTYFGKITDDSIIETIMLVFSLIPISGGALALVGYRKWGGLSTILGKAILLLGCGIFLWGCGALVYGYYLAALHLKVIYPSIADFFFVPAVFFYTAGAIYLSRTTGIGMGWRNKIGKAFAIVAPFIIFAIAYYLLVFIGRNNQIIAGEGDVLKTVLNIIDPLGDFVSLTVSVVVAGLSFRYLGGMYKREVISILAGMAVMFLADSLFAYATTIGSKYKGDLGDLIYAVGMFLLTFGLLGFNKIKQAEPAPAD